MKFIKFSLVFSSLALISTLAMAQCKMDSDGRTLRNSSNSSIGRIDSDGVTIRNGSNSSVGRVDSDGVTIRNSSNSMVLRIDGNNIRNSSNSTIATMSDMLRDMQGAKPDAVHVALWWFVCKGN